MPSRSQMCLLCCTSLSLITLHAAEDDKNKEDMSPPPAHWAIPPAPVVPANEAHKTFQLQDGYRLQLVAAEPMVEKPVALSWDGDGRLFVCEMRGYMNNVKGSDEGKPTGRVSLLTDSNGDGTMDKATIFADNLVMPRAICWVNGGLLVAEPPKIWFFQDKNGDGEAESKTVVYEKYGTAKNPEHSANGLVVGFDNWIYSANHTERYRFVAGKLIAQPSNFRGQWGCTYDNYGRPFYNSNSDQLRTDAVDYAYYARNSHFIGGGVNLKASLSNETFPVRMNPGVNRGYRKDQLRENGTLASFTAACGPGVYRGDLFPDWVGDVFLCEPAGNFVRRAKVITSEGDKNSSVMTENAYAQKEFLASHDERFRPVNCYTGPDGALYVVDMYVGVVQHRMFLTPYLKKQAIERGLEGGSAQYGRIWRVIPKTGKFPNTSPKLEQASIETLVQNLSHANGWRRDTAQRLLIERQAPSAIPLLRELATRGTDKFARIHALFTLNALGDREVSTWEMAVKDTDAHVRSAALKNSEPLLTGDQADAWLKKIIPLLDDQDSSVQLQAAFTIGLAADGKADDIIATSFSKPVNHALWDDALIAGIAGREFRMLQRLCSDTSFNDANAEKKAVLIQLAKNVMAHNKSDTITQTLSLAAQQLASGPWRCEAILDGILSAKTTNAQAGSIKLARSPENWAALDKEPKLADRVKAITSWIAWKGNAAQEHMVEQAVLSPDEQKLFAAGKMKYQMYCAACHQLTGQGLAGLAPPLASSEWVEGPAGRLARIIIYGVSGEITAAGVTFTGEMPPLGPALDDQAVAEIMTYVRNEWGNNASAVAPADITALRAKEGNRSGSWTAQELLKIK